MLSIVIPVYNFNIVDLVHQLNDQLSTLNVNYEIICRDDYSTDPTVTSFNSNISKLPNCFYFENSTNLGRTQTRELLANQATFEWLLFLDADVIPANTTFITTYLQAISNEAEVIFGGYNYIKPHLDSATMLRWKYGIERESISAHLRNKRPYSYIFSGNLLIKKATFSSIEFPNESWYGMDIYFAYYLFQKQAKILHIDNPIYHLGLEENEVFFNKSLEAVKSRLLYLKNEPEIEEINGLIKKWKILKKWKIKGIIGLLFKATAPLLRKTIVSKNPNLLLFDIYRLGYSCTLKD